MIRSFLWLPLLCVAGLSLGTLRAAADATPRKKPASLARLSANAQQLYAETTLFPQSTRWLEIPWMTDLAEAVRTAKRENRPVLVWVSGDDPLERC